MKENIEIEDIKQELIDGIYFINIYFEENKKLVKNLNDLNNQYFGDKSHLKKLNSHLRKCKKLLQQCREEILVDFELNYKEYIEHYNVLHAEVLHTPILIKEFLAILEIEKNKK